MSLTLAQAAKEAQEEITESFEFPSIGHVLKRWETLPPLKPAPKESILTPFERENLENELRCIKTRENWILKKLGEQT